VGETSAGQRDDLDVCMLLLCTFAPLIVAIVIKQTGQRMESLGCYVTKRMWKIAIELGRCALYSHHEPAFVLSDRSIVTLGVELGFVAEAAQSLTPDRGSFGVKENFHICFLVVYS
jgi:hypothetical protein